MKDLGIQVRVLDCARDLIKRAPASALAPRARELVTLFGNNGAFDPATATAADAARCRPIFDRIIASVRLRKAGTVEA